jgi:hypothetical protein
MINIWKGKKYLKLEHCTSPWYTTNRGKDFCLKHHFTVWGWSLATRMVKRGYKEEYVRKAEYVFGHVSPVLTKKYDAVDKYEDHLDLFCKTDYPTLYCYNIEGDLLGRIDDLKWMFTHNCVADKNLAGVAYSQTEGGYIGYSHRARQIFKIGDKLFDPKYEPQELDYEEWEWAGFLQDQARSQKEHNDLGEEYIVPIKDVIPFKKRGSVLIKTPKEARKAAHNFSKYVS